MIAPLLHWEWVSRIKCSVLGNGPCCDQVEVRKYLRATVRARFQQVGPSYVQTIRGQITLGDSAGIPVQSTMVDLPLKTCHLSGTTPNAGDPNHHPSHPVSDNTNTTEMSKPTQKFCPDPLWYPFYPKPIPPPYPFPTQTSPPTRTYFSP